MIEYSYLPTEKEISRTLFRVQMSGYRIIIYLAFVFMVPNLIMDSQRHWSGLDYTIYLVGFIFIIFMSFKYRFRKAANNLLDLASATDSIKFDLENRLILTNSKLVYATESFALFNTYKIFNDKIFLIRKNIKFTIIYKKGFKSDEDFQRVAEAIKFSGMNSM